MNRRATELIRVQRHPVRTITADNGTEFHDYPAIERATGTQFYFATPHHAWERGTNENTNGLIRQYLPKRQPDLTQVMFIMSGDVVELIPQCAHAVYAMHELQMATPLIVDASVINDCVANRFVYLQRDV